MLTSQNVEAIQDWIWACGVMEKLDASQFHAACTDLFWIVELIVTEALDKQLAELKTAAVLATTDCLDEQRCALFRVVQSQFAHPQ